MSLSAPFGNFSGLIRAHAAQRPEAPALAEGDRRLSYAQLDTTLDRIASGLQRQGLAPGGRVALCGNNSLDYALLMLATLRAGGVPALVQPAVTDEDKICLEVIVQIHRQDAIRQWLEGRN